jgi:mRNA-degrading endonuclease HigB of HigAB toxin-antitoxin module
VQPKNAFLPFWDRTIIRTVMYVRFVGTHVQYDRINVEEI